MSARPASALLQTPGGACLRLSHGDLIGRLPTAALVLDDPRVSEAHALCALRRGKLWLLSLRRLLAVAGRPVSEVLLTEGLSIELAPGVCLLVKALDVPTHVPGLSTPGLPPHVLGQVASLVEGEPARGVYLADAPAHVWTDGDRCFLKVGAGAPRALEGGDGFEAAGRTWRVVLLEVREASAPPTVDAGQLRLVSHYDSVVVWKGDFPALTLGGVAAQIVGELGTRGTAAPWEAIARTVWADGERAELRHRWDVTLTRMRAKLRAAGVRDDLVRADATGNCVLNLAPGDAFEDLA